MDTPNITSLKVTLCIHDTVLGYKEYSYKTAQSLTLGRSKDNHIILNSKDLTLSRHHCRLEIQPSQVLIQDCGSKTGTFLNGSLIGKRSENENVNHFKQSLPCSLADGDIISLGKSVKIVLNIQTTALCSVCHHPLLPEECSTGICAFCMQKEISHVQEGQESELLTQPQAEQGKWYWFGRPLGIGQPGTIVFQIRGTNRAIKIFPRHKDYASKVRFQREAQIGCLLHHENLVQTYQFGYLPTKIPYLVMEACNGMTLIEFKHKMGKHLKINTCVDIIQCILNALIYMHNVTLHIKKLDGSVETMHCIIHRDLKPSNILVHADPDNPHMFHIKVADLGIVKPHEMNDDPNITGAAVVGTYEYMPREQANSSQNVTSRVDVWSTAAILFFLLTDEPPRGKRTHGVIFHDARKIQTVNPHIPDSLASILDRALLENGEAERITTAEEFSRLLSQWRSQRK